MEKETKLKLALFWFAVAISIIGWAICIWFMSTKPHSTQSQIPSKTAFLTVIYGTIVFGLFWLNIVGTIQFLVKRVRKIFKILLLIYIAIVLFMLSLDFFYGAIFAWPLTLFCASQFIMDMINRKIKTTFREIGTKIAMFVFVAITILVFSLMYFVYYPYPDISGRIIFNAIFALLIGSHVWVVYGMILYTKAIYKSIRIS